MTGIDFQRSQQDNPLFYPRHQSVSGARGQVEDVIASLEGWVDHSLDRPILTDKYNCDVLICFNISELQICISVLSFYCHIVEVSVGKCIMLLK